MGTYSGIELGILGTTPPNKGHTYKQHYIVNDVRRPPHLQITAAMIFASRI